MTFQQAVSPKASSARKRKKANPGTSEPIDIGTREFAKRYTLKPELIGAGTGYAVHMRVVDGTEIDRLLLKNKINLQEHIVAHKVAGDLHRANFSKMSSSKMEPVSHSHDPHGALLTDKMIEVGKLFKYLDKNLGVKARNMITNILLDITQVSSETDLELFRMGLLLVAIKLERSRF